MSSLIRRLVPSPEMAVAVVALVVAITSVSYAAIRLPANGVKRAQLASNAVVGSKVADDSLTGDDVKESTLKGIPGASLREVSYKTAPGVAPPAASVDLPGHGAASALCGSGERAIGGGVRLEAPESGEIADTFPDRGGSIWTAHGGNGDTTSSHGFLVYAICVPAETTG